MAQPQPADKFRRFRERRRAEGLKEVRLWVRDPEAPGFRDQLSADIERINGSLDGADALRWVEAALEDVWGAIEADEAERPA